MHTHIKKKIKTSEEAPGLLFSILCKIAIVALTRKFLTVPFYKVKN